VVKRKVEDESLQHNYIP